MRVTFWAGPVIVLAASFGLLQSSGCFPDAILNSSASSGSGGSTSNGSGGGGATSGTGGSSGTAGGGQGGSGGDLNCDHCPGEDTTCSYRICDGGCDMENAAAGTPCTENGGQLCDGAGHCVECLTESDCTEPGDQCISNWCGTPTGANGDPCQTPADCINGNCPQDDHICCDYACDTPCMACAAAKTCGPDGICAPIVAGTDPDGECTNSACFGGSCQTGKIAFVTSAIHDGNFGGLAGADTMCATHATMGCLPGTYLAWMSTANASPNTRFTQSSIPYRLVDGTQIADNYNDLTDFSLDAALNMDEKGDPPPLSQLSGNCQSDVSYMGTKADGTAANTATERCNEWTTTSAEGSWGRHSSTSNLWSLYCVGGGGNTCSIQAAITCFEQ